MGRDEIIRNAMNDFYSDPAGTGATTQANEDRANETVDRRSDSVEQDNLELEESQDDSVDDDTVDIIGDQNDPRSDSDEFDSNLESDETRPMFKFNGKEYDLSTADGQESFSRDQQAYFTRKRQADAEEARRQVEQVNRDREEFESQRREVEQLKADLEMILSKPDNEQLREQYQDLYKEDRIEKRIADLEKSLEREREAKRQAENDKYRVELFSRLDTKLKVPADLNSGLVDAVRDRALRRASDLGLTSEDDFGEIYRAEIEPLMQLRRSQRKNAAAKKQRQLRSGSASGAAGTPPKIRQKTKADEYGGKPVNKGGLENKLRSVLSGLEID